MPVETRDTPSGLSASAVLRTSAKCTPAFGIRHGSARSKLCSRKDGYSDTDLLCAGSRASNERYHPHVKYPGELPDRRISGLRKKPET